MKLVSAFWTVIAIAATIGIMILLIGMIRNILA